MPATFTRITGSRYSDADPTGATDAAAKLNAELLATPTGGTLRLRHGTFRCDSPLTIPAGVTLAGTWGHYAGAMQRGGIDPALASYGTIIANSWTTTATAATDPCFITLADYSGLTGVVILDKKQGLPGTTGVARPFQVGTNYGTAARTWQGPDSPAIRCVSILNAWRGVRMWGAYRFLLEDVLVSACRQGFDVDCVYDTSRMDRCHVIPTYWCALDSSVPAAIESDILANLIGYRFGRCDSVLLDRSMIYLGKTGLLFNQSAQSLTGQPNSPWVRVSNFDVDVCDLGIDIQATAQQGVRFSNLGITTPVTSTTNIGVRVGSAAGSYGFAGCTVQCQTAKEFRIAGGRGTLTGCAINSFNRVATGSSASIIVTGGSLAVTGCDFAEARPQLSNTGTGRVSFAGNLTNSGENTSGTIITAGNN